MTNHETETAAGLLTDWIAKYHLAMAMGRQACADIERQRGDLSFERTLVPALSRRLGDAYKCLDGLEADKSELQGAACATRITLEATVSKLDQQRADNAALETQLAGQAQQIEDLLRKNRELQGVVDRLRERVKQ